MGDSSFMLPGTECCIPGVREGDDVQSRGGGIRFEVLASRNYSIRILAVRHARNPPFFQFTPPDTGIYFDFNDDDRTFGVLGDPSCISSSVLCPSSGAVLERVEGRDPIFWPISKKFKGKIYLDQTFHGRGSPNQAIPRPFDCWVDCNRRLGFYGQSTVERSLDEQDGRLFGFSWFVIVHVGSWGVEKENFVHSESMDVDAGSRRPVTVVHRPFVGGPDPQVEGVAPRGSRLSSGKMRVRESSAESEAETVILDKGDNSVQRFPAVEIRNVSARYYWRDVTAPN